jgi:hypothetical protein
LSQLRKLAACQRGKYERDTGMAWAQWFFNDSQHLHASGLQHNGFFCECHEWLLKLIMMEDEAWTEKKLSL